MGSKVWKVHRWIKPITHRRPKPIDHGKHYFRSMVFKYIDLSYKSHFWGKSSWLPAWWATWLPWWPPAKCSNVSMSCGFLYLQKWFLFLYHFCILSEIKFTTTTECFEIWSLLSYQRFTAFGSNNDFVAPGTKPLYESNRLFIYSLFRIDALFHEKCHVLTPIWPWIKSIFNELDINFHVLVSQLSGHVTELGRHQQNVNRAGGTRSRCMGSVFLSPCMDWLCRARKKNNVYCRDELFMPSFECYFSVYFPLYFTTPEIDTTIILSWPHKQFATTVSSKYLIENMVF